MVHFGWWQIDDMVSLESMEDRYILRGHVLSREPVVGPRLERAGTQKDCRTPMSPATRVSGIFHWTANITGDHVLRVLTSMCKTCPVCRETEEVSRWTLGSWWTISSPRRAWRMQGPISVYLLLPFNWSRKFSAPVAVCVHVCVCAYTCVVGGNGCLFFVSQGHRTVTE